MSRGKHRGGLKAILEEAVASHADLVEQQEPETKSWLSAWLEPVRARNRVRSLLGSGLKGNLVDIPTQQTIRYLQEMADDVALLGSDAAVDIFLDKILPPIDSDGATQAGPRRD